MNDELHRSRQMQALRSRQMTAVYAVMVSLLFLVLLQFWLLGNAIEGLLAGRRGIIFPAAAVSGLCFLAAFWLIRVMVERTSSRER